VMTGEAFCRVAKWEDHSEGRMAYGEQWTTGVTARAFMGEPVWFIGANSYGCSSIDGIINNFRIDLRACLSEEGR